MEPAENKEESYVHTFITRQSWEKAREEVDPHVLNDLLLIYHYWICKYFHLSIKFTLIHDTALNTFVNDDTDSNTIKHTNLKRLVTVNINLTVATQHTAEYLVTNSNAAWREIYLNRSGFARKFYIRSTRLTRPSQACQKMAALH